MDAMIDPVGRAKGAHLSKLKWMGKLDDARAPRAPDSVQISEMARLLDRMRRLPEVRMDKVTEAQRQILDGTYLTAAKLDAAILRAREEGDL